MILKKLFAIYQGRIPRSVYWLTLIAVLVFAKLFDFLTADVAEVSFSQGEDGEFSAGYSQSSSIGLLDLIVALALFAITFLVYIKRLHDMDKSGWFSLLMLIPVVNIAVGFFWLGFVKGTDGPNQYGADPLGGGAEIEKPAE